MHSLQYISHLTLSHTILIAKGVSVLTLLHMQIESGLDSAQLPSNNTMNKILLHPLSL